MNTYIFTYIDDDNEEYEDMINAESEDDAKIEFNEVHGEVVINSIESL